MTRDYKHRVNKKKKTAQPIAGWWWLVTGLMIGGFVIFLMDLQENTQPNRTHKEITKSSQPIAIKKPTTTPKESSNTKPRFDFYTILPDVEVVIPDHEVETMRRLEGTGKGRIGIFHVQIGSFRKLSQADTMKAQVAMLGIETKIDKTNNKGSIWYRVKAGPFNKFNQVDKIQNTLHRNRIDSIVIEQH